ncbi:hypothetical protein QJS66_03535 [Kocuria rhizophila]|nr:hypothetical protein QJS66_03535 [Kocuria rhizophila]
MTEPAETPDCGGQPADGRTAPLPPEKEQEAARCRPLVPEDRKAAKAESSRPSASAARRP